METSTGRLHAHSWLVALQELPADGSAAVFIRHAERYPIIDVTSHAQVLLTPQGEADAVVTGSLLPPDRCVRLWHSRVRRCKQTAERIAEGFATAGGRVELAGELESLCGSFVRDSDGFSALTRQHGGNDFIRSWFDGCFDPAVIDPRDVAAARLLSVAQEALGTSQPDSLNLLVTHDWEIMTMRETYLGVRHEDVGWAEYLDGLAMAWDGHTTQFAWREFRGRSPRGL